MKPKLKNQLETNEEKQHELLVIAIKLFLMKVVNTMSIKYITEEI